MTFGIKLKGTRSERKKGPDRWIEDLAEYIRTFINPALEMHIEIDRVGRPCLFLHLHPAAEPLMITASLGEKVSLKANTDNAGPGYHIAVCNLIKTMSKEKGITWDVPNRESGTGDDTSYLYMADEAILKQHFLTLLEFRCRQALITPVDQSTERYVTRPGPAPESNEVKFLFQLPQSASPVVAGPLGFRDGAWIKAFQSNQSKGVDFFPWWHNSLAGLIFGTAIIRLWCDVPWRKPINEEESHRMRMIARDLETAYELNSQLPFPWAAWHELNEFLKDSGEPLKLPDLVRRNAEAFPDQGPVRVGYRRRSFRCGFGGWTVKIPGDFVEPRIDRQTLEVRSPGGPVRIIRMSLPRRFAPARHGGELSSRELVANLSQPEPNAEGLMEVQGPGDRMGRAWWESTFSEGKNLWWLKSIMAVRSQAVLVSIFVEDDNDKQWAIDTWKTLLPDSHLEIVASDENSTKPPVAQLSVVQPALAPVLI